MTSDTTAPVRSRTLEPSRVQVARAARNVMTALHGDDDTAAEERIRLLLAPHAGTSAPLLERSGELVRLHRCGSVTLATDESNTRVVTASPERVATTLGLGGRLRPEAVIVPPSVVTDLATRRGLYLSGAEDTLGQLLTSAAKHPTSPLTPKHTRRYVVGDTVLVLSATHHLLISTGALKHPDDLAAAEANPVPLDVTTMGMVEGTVRVCARHLGLSVPSPGDQLGRRVVVAAMRVKLAEADGETGEAVTQPDGRVVHVHTGTGWRATFLSGNRVMARFEKRRQPGS